MDGQPILPGLQRPADESPMHPLLFIGLHVVGCALSTPKPTLLYCALLY